MLKDIVAVKPLVGYQLFSGIFAPLQDRATFAQVEIHPELGTLVWQNGADLDPDVLYAIVAKSPIPDYSRTAQ